MLKRISCYYIAAYLAGLFFMTTSCSDKDLYDPNYRDTSVGDALSTLDFSTAHEVKMNFNYDVAKGFISQFELYSTNPFEKNSSGAWVKKEDATPIASGIHIQGTSNIVRTIPVYITTLYAYSPSLFVPTLMSAKITGTTASFEVFDISMSTSGTRGAATRSITTGSIDEYLFKGTPTIYEHKDIPAEVLTQIAHTFPNDIAVTDNNYFADASMELLRDDDGDGIEVFLSVITAESGMNNSLSYFCYDGPKSDLPTLSEAQKQNLKIISAFQYAKLDNGLKSGDYIQLKYWNGTELVDKFPKNITIGWVLSAHGFYQEGSDYKIRNNSTEYPWFYSVAEWNPETAPLNKHTIRFSVEDNDGENFVCFGFEDLQREKSQLSWWNSDGDCNDVMFHVITNPVNALDPPPVIPTPGEIKAYDNRKGIVAYEDNWPRKDDYDMNDVVVRYNSDITYVQKTLDETSGKIDPEKPQYISRVKDEFTLIHSGADFRNSFSVQYQIPYDNIESIEVTGTIKEYLYKDDAGFVLHLCELVQGVIEPYVTNPTPKVYTVNIKFKDGTVLASDFDTNKYMHAPYNPYISPSSHIQVHLPDYVPVWDSSMKNYGMDYFGMGSDRSRMKEEIDENGEGGWTGRWYVSGNQNSYPYAIHLVEETTYALPIEKHAIDTAYPDYIPWVNSGCTKYTDWYLKPNSNVQK